jgi:integrase
MPSLKRIKTNYPGVFYIESTSSAGKPEKIFYVRYRKNGKMVEEKAGRQFQDDMTAARASRIRAEKIEGKKLSRKEAREAAAATKWTVDRLWQEYISHKPATKGFKTDRYRYEKFLKAGFGGKEPADLVQLDIHRLRISLAKTLKPQTVKHVLRLLQRIVNFGTKKGLCGGLSFKIEFPQVHNLRTEDLTPEQLTSLVEAIDQEPDQQAANFLRLVLYTGMRRGELFRLQWRNLDFDRGFIHIMGAKGGRDQVIPLNEAARKVLESHPRDESPFVFPGRGGRQRTRYPKAIDRIREKAGLPPDFRPIHGLRHFFASQLASSGEVDLYLLQRLLTHRSPQMTMRYAHLRDEALRRASDLAGVLLGQMVKGKNGEIANLKAEE